jgi:outer membrane lipoprotein SlyB
MDINSPQSSQKPRLHPLVATAAVSVIVLAAVGVTALVMNRSDAQPSPYGPPAVAGAPAAQQPVTPAPQLASNTPAAPNPAPSTPSYNEPVVAQAPVCRDCGVVDSIRDIKVKGQGTGVGAVGGAVVGGLLGNMVGAGRGKALATVAGAVGGGFGGNAIEKNVRSEVEHQMVVRLDNGGTRTFTQASPFPYREGERVRIVDGHVERG